MKLKFQNVRVSSLSWHGYCMSSPTGRMQVAGILSKSGHRNESGKHQGTNIGRRKLFIYLFKKPRAPVCTESGKHQGTLVKVQPEATDGSQKWGSTASKAQFSTLTYFHDRNYTGP